MAGHAGRGVDLQQEGLAVAGTDHDVGPRPAAAAQRAESLDHDALDLGLLAHRQAAGAVVLRGVREVLVLVVVVALGRDDADHWQGPGLRSRAQHGTGGFITGDELLAQHLGVVFGGQRIGRRAFIGRHHLGHADARSLAGRLDDHGGAQGFEGSARFVDAGDHAPIGRGQSLEAPDALGHDLVHGDARGHHSRPRVGNPEQLQRALDRAVLAIAAVQRDEAAVEPLHLELIHVLPGRVERVGIDAPVLQGLEHTGARHQRDFALGRAAAHEHRHLAQVGHVDL